VDNQDHELSELRAALADYQRLKDENATLRQFLVENGIPVPVPPASLGSSPARMFERRLKGYDAIGYTVERAGVSAPAPA